MPQPLILTGYRDADGSAGPGLLLQEGRVGSAEQAQEAMAAGTADSVDLSGYMLLPAFAEPHAHLDKALTWDSIEPPVGDLDAAIDAWAVRAPHVSPDETRQRALSALHMLLAHGCTAVRTHVDVPNTPNALDSLRVLTQLRTELRGVLDLQLVAFIQRDVPSALIDEALRLAPDRLGGFPHIASEPLREQTRLLDHAKRAGVGVDLHTDERLDPDSRCLSHLAEHVLVHGFPLPVTASHCVSLSQQSVGERRDTISAVAAARIGVVALPQTNLLLQGRDTEGGSPRGIAPLIELMDAGVAVAGGGDNLRDPFNPLGRGDPLETASLLVAAAHLPLEAALHCVATGARDVLGLPPAGLEPGLIADLVAIRAETLSEAMAGASAERIVFKEGAIVARTDLSRSSALIH